MAGVGILGVQARVQYAALARLRWHMFTNGLRSNKGALELGARTVSFVIYACIGLGLGAGAGAAAFVLGSGGEWRYLPILFWAVCFIWQMVPIMLASFQEQFDLSILLRFPVRFGSYFLLYVVFGLADISSIVGGLCCVGIWTGITAVRPELFAWTALGLAAFAAFNILLVRAIFAWIDRWLAQRRTREILGALFMVLMLSLQLLNPALHQTRHQGRMTREERAEDYRQMGARFAPWLKTANAVQMWLPPGLAARALRQAADQQPGLELESLGLLGLYGLAVGGILSGRLRAEYRGESLGQAASRKKAAATRTSPERVSLERASLDRTSLEQTSLARRQGNRLLDGSGPMAAVMEKELRTLLRTVPVLYALGAPIVLVFVFSTMFRNTAPHGARPFSLALPLGMAYALLGFTQLLYNNLGAEGAGIQVYFLAPARMRTVLLAKNLFHSVLFVLDALLAGLLVTLRVGHPSDVVIAATAAWLLFALPANMAAGNVFSLTLPYRVNPGRITRQRGSQANALLSLLVQVVVLGVGAAVFGLCSLFDRMWLAVPVFLALAAGAAFAWLRVLRNADEMASRRKDALLATLMKTE